MIPKTAVVSWILAVHWITWLRFAEPKVPQEEVDALQQIANTMGAIYWSFDAESCEVKLVGLTQPPPPRAEGIVKCEPETGNSSILHVVEIVLKRHSLPGVLPPELAKLPYIRNIDFAYNYLSGSIPVEWASIKLNSTSLLGNRLSGEIPKELANITSLTYLNLEANQFSGTVPSELGQLRNLHTMIMSSNRLMGKLPDSFSELTNLTDFRMNDNNFSGPIPDYIQNWKQLSRIEMYASGLEGPIPSTIYLLKMLTELSISDITGPRQVFPELRNLTGIVRLVLRNCNLFGELPAYIWQMRNLGLIDVSFNKLEGKIPDDIAARSLKFVYLTGNLLSGDVPESILTDGSNVDLSYNNFTWQSADQPACQSRNLYVNLFKSASGGNNLKGVFPCKDVKCSRTRCSLHINSGGNELTIEENNRKVVYEGDADVEGGSAKYYINPNSYWGFSSTGDFLDDGNVQNTRFVKTASGTSLSGLYRTARVSPLSLTYFSPCLENGFYNVNLHFAEIQFTNNNTYTSLGRRIFDIYIQDNLVKKDFNIEEEGGGVARPVIRHFNASVTNNFLEIRLYWAGKGTTRFPERGVYGSLISAISVNPYSKSCSSGEKKQIAVYAAIGVVAACILFLALGIIWWKCWLQGRKKKQKDSEGLEFQTVSFTLKQIKAATNNFDAANKIGEGGFGPVHKGLLSDGTLIAVKQLSSKSRQGNREFLNEIGMISCFQHPNLVKLHGCCIEGNQLMLIYEYMENNSLARALFDDNQLTLDWATRFKICVGIARGLAFLHEESRLKIVHRDIKATNVLLDKDLNPKISDFGLARLNEDEKTHISTRVAGTIGYMAPEYALWGYLTYKADVYSFGIVVLEIISGKNYNNYMPSNNCVCLLEWACQLDQNGNIEDLIDERLGSKLNKKEAETMAKIALLCTNATPSLRPTMSEVVSMLEGKMAIPDVIPEASSYTNDLRFKAMRDFHHEKKGQSSSGSQTQHSTTLKTDVASFSTVTNESSDISPDSTFH